MSLSRRVARKAKRGSLRWALPGAPSPRAAVLAWRAAVSLPYCWVLFPVVCCVFFFRFFLRGVVFFRIFVAVFQFFAVGAPLFSSASAVVAACGFARLRALFAGFVVSLPAGPGSAPSGRVAAACPAFVGALVGRGLCGWSVAWSVASLVASSWGVSVLSGGVAAPGVQLSLFS